MGKVKIFLCAILIVGMASQTPIVREDAHSPVIDHAITRIVEEPVLTEKAYPSIPAFLLQGTSRVKVEGGFGSAFAVDLSEFGLTGNNYVITAAHVVLDDKGKLQENIEVEVSIAKYKTRVYVPATVVFYNKDIDMAVLAVEVDVTGHSRIAKSDTMNIGDAIAIVGCPSGTFPTVTFGYLVAKEFEIYGRKLPDVLWQGSATIYPGNSGGPVFNPNTGEIIGIAVAGLNQHGFAGHVDFFVPMYIMRELINGNLDKFKKFEGSNK